MLNYLLPIGAYLLGSVSTAIIVARLAGLEDPRRVGSRNPGATNILRIGSKKTAAVTLIGDMVKGLLAVVIAWAFTADTLILALVALAVFLGHLYPVFFGFKGGKGVATALGVYLGLNPYLALLMLATWLAVAAIFRYSSLAALAAAALSPAYVWWLTRSPVYLVMSIVLALLLFWRHRSNIRNLATGAETKIGAKT